MTKAKSYKHMDTASGQQAAYLDKKREAAKKRQAQARRDRTSLSRGGFR